MRKGYVVAAAGVAVVGVGVVVWRKYKEDIIDAAINIALPLPAKPREEEVTVRCNVNTFNQDLFNLYKLNVLDELVKLARPQAHLTDAAADLIHNYISFVKKQFLACMSAEDTAKALNCQPWQPDDEKPIGTFADGSLRYADEVEGGQS